MPDYQIYLQFNIFPQVVRRGQHVLILLQNTQQKFILAQKKIYPKGISRMVGGGMDQGEKPETAAAREVEEETGLHINPKQLVSLATVTANLTNALDEQITFVTHVFYYNVGEQTLTPQDDVDHLNSLTEAEYFQLLHQYEQLPTTLDEKLGFSWFDYGQLYGFIHRLAIDQVRDL